MPARLYQIAATAVAVTVFMLRVGAAFGAGIHPGEHFENVTIDHLDRSYIVHVPPQFDDQHEVPAVIMLHGSGGSAEEAESYTGFDDESDREGFIVAYPNATLPFPNRASARYTNPALWHERCGLGDLASRSRADVDFISAVIDELERDYSADPDRIYVTGFSNGASMTFSLGVNLSDRLAAIAPVSGQFPDKQGSLSYPLPLLFIVGDEDPIHPFEGDELPLTGPDIETPTMKTLLHWRQMLECKERKMNLVSEGVTQLRFNDCTRGGEIVAYTVEGLGHIWPGAPNTLTRWLGHSSCKLMATQVIWQFFKTHPRVKPAVSVPLANLPAGAAASPQHQ